jgi:3-methylcrotonyl-CoA carboxylase alpha subunit
MSGHAIEARLNAEDPVKGFLPSIGRIMAFETPAMAGLRVDAGVEAGSTISPYYDSMIAKLIASGTERSGAIALLAAALEAAHVAGPKTNAAFLHTLITHAAFGRAEIDTGFIGRELDRLAAGGLDAKAVGFGIMHMLWHAHEDVELVRRASSGETYSPWSAQDAFQLGPPRRQALTVLADGVPTKAEVVWGRDGPNVTVVGDHAPPPWERRTISVVGESSPAYVLHDMRQTELAWPTFDAAAGEDDGDGSTVRAPIIGRVAKVFVKEGDAVAKGDRIAVVEAMKMEHVLHAARDGKVEKLAVKEGQQVTQGALIASLA